MNSIFVFIRIVMFQAAAVLLLGVSSQASFVPDTLQTSLESPENIRSFADHLFGQKDYLRAYSEYSKLSETENDSVHFRIAASLSGMGRFAEAESVLKSLLKKPAFNILALPLMMKNRWLTDDLKGLRALCDTLEINPDAGNNNCSPLYYASFLIDSLPLPGIEEFENAFPSHSRAFMKKMYERKNENKYKLPLKAALMSAVIPGAGKIYAGQTSDGITAFVVTGILGYLAWDNFRSGHDFRAWTFSGLGALFYAGNIYGSAAQARIFNAEINYNFQKDLNIFLQEKNYFIPVYVP